MVNTANLPLKSYFNASLVIQFKVTEYRIPYCEAATSCPTAVKIRGDKSCSK